MIGMQNPHLFPAHLTHFIASPLKFCYGRNSIANRMLKSPLLSPKRTRRAGRLCQICVKNSRKTAFHNESKLKYSIALNPPHLNPSLGSVSPPPPLSPPHAKKTTQPHRISYKRMHSFERLTGDTINVL